MRSLTTGRTNIVAIAFNPNGQVLAEAQSEGCGADTSVSAIKLWDWQTGKLLQTLSVPSQTGGIHALAFSSDNRILASGGKDGSIHLWDTHTGKELKTLTGHTNAVIALSFAPTGRTLVSGSDDRTVKVWQVQALI
ncbi:hypothetical protein [Nostoc sp. 106C]|uniref:WD40 repeat domain-containing protein n=1 Tax=Nostoc sp. 106C TaxID=1932667 RepID=UPI000B66282D|nr:hypothetical protein [Nostoc sp. 106C]OUL26994.1 hypothetical protein BV375_20110 [Nostoc sp. 106C]